MKLAGHGRRACIWMASRLQTTVRRRKGCTSAIVTREHCIYSSQHSTGLPGEDDGHRGCLFMAVRSRPSKKRVGPHDEDHKNLKEVGYSGSFGRQPLGLVVWLYSFMPLQPDFECYGGTWESTHVALCAGIAHSSGFCIHRLRLRTASTAGFQWLNQAIESLWIVASQLAPRREPR
jgi:hypothetical protein